MEDVLVRFQTRLQRYLSGPQSEGRTRICRVVCLMASIMIVVFWGVYRFATPSAVDPLWLRVAVASVPLGLWGASFRSDWVRRHFSLLTQGTACLLLIWMVGLTALNDLTVNYAVGLLFSVAAMYVAVVLVVDRLLPLVLFCGISLVLIAALFLYEPSSSVRAEVFVTSIAGLAALVCTQLVLMLQARRSLAESEERHRAVLSQTGEGVFLVDATDLAFIEVNAAYCRLTGYAPGELRRRTLRDMEEDDGALAHLENLRHREHFKSDTRHRCKDGSFVEVEVSADLIRYAGQEAICAVVRDIEAHKETERMLRRSKAQAEQTLRAKSSLLNNMSHELRTPLSSIIGYAEVLGEETETPHHREFAQAIEESGERLRDVLSAVLELARLEGGDIELAPSPFDMLDVARSVLEEVRPEAERKELSLHLESGVSAVHVYTDQRTAEHILRPLLDNAVKFTSSGRVAVKIEDHGETVQVRVTDSGPGILDEQRPQLFEAFAQGSGGLARTHKGIGVGLTLARHRTQLLGGTLQVVETDSQGTTFLVELPKRLQRSTELATAHETAPSSV